MPSDPNPRSVPPLKRFARLEMDGDPPAPPRAHRADPAAKTAARTPTVAARAASTEPDDIAQARALAAELTANSRQSLAQTTPQARRADRAQQLRERMSEPERTVRNNASGMTRTTVRFEAPAGRAFIGPDGGRGLVEPRNETRRTLRDPATQGWDPPSRELQTPGVVVMEIDLREERVAVSERPRMPGMSWESGPRARSEPRAQPIELSPMAARQVMLMAWEAGMPGSGLRVLTSQGSGLGGPELDFAFDDDVQDDDAVFLSHGVRIIVDPESLRHVRGRRITWHDVPGSEGFAVR